MRYSPAACHFCRDQLGARVLSERRCRLSGAWYLFNYGNDKRAIECDVARRRCELDDFECNGQQRRGYGQPWLGIGFLQPGQNYEWGNRWVYRALWLGMHPISVSAITWRSPKPMTRSRAGPGRGENSSWCDRGWTSTGTLERGQIVAVTGVNGTTITISPGLYSTYTNTPIAVPFSMSEAYAGVEDLQVHANNTGYAANFGMSECAYCWIKGVESNDTDGDHVEVYWGYHDEIRDSYFLNAFLHTSRGARFRYPNCSENHCEPGREQHRRATHGSVVLDSGAAGNVVSYNYGTGESDSSSTERSHRRNRLSTERIRSSICWKATFSRRSIRTQSGWPPAERRPIETG